ncbi:surface protease GP63, putative, partial [Trypanosoma cruzi marinkellei]
MVVVIGAAPCCAAPLLVWLQSLLALFSFLPLPFPLPRTRSLPLLLLLLLPLLLLALPLLPLLLLLTPSHQMHLVHAMLPPRHVALPLVLWLMMCCASGCLAADPAMQHRCGLDEVMKYGSLPTAVVREVPRRGQAAVQVYTVATQDADSEWAPIRIKVSARDLYNQSKHCSAAWETRTNYDGEQITCASRDVLTE